MRSGPIDLPALKSPIQRAASWAGGLLGIVCLTALRCVIETCRLLMILALRLLRPIVGCVLLLGCIGGVVATVGFAVQHLWSDAARAASVVFACALVLRLYSWLLQAIDPSQFNVVVTERRLW